MRAFYDVRFYEELVEVAKGQTEVSQANYSLVKRQIELGLKAGADLYESESLLLSDKLNLTQSENKLELAKLQLMQEMNLEDRDNFYVARKSKRMVFSRFFKPFILIPSTNRQKTFFPCLKRRNSA